jgi:hypothetical protein
MIATGLTSHALSPYGRDAQSIALFRTPGTEKLYSGALGWRRKTLLVSPARSEEDRYSMWRA